MEPNETLFTCIEKKDWDTLVTILKPNDFCTDMPRSLDDFKKLVKVSELLLQDYISERVINVLLKCLANSCVAGYLQRTYVPKDKENALVQENIYKFLSQQLVENNEFSKDYSYTTHFPYDGTIQWVVKTLKDYVCEDKALSEEQNEVLRLSLQFLCNFFTFCFNIKTTRDAHLVIEYIKNENFTNSILKLIAHDRAPIARAACAFIHNMVKNTFDEFYAMINKKKLTAQLIKSTISDIHAALDTIVLLLKAPTYLKDIYDEISIDDKLYLLDIIHQEVRSVTYDENDEIYWLPVEVVEFLSECFKKKSDLILKTSESQTKDLEPTEITILLDILCVMSSNPKIKVFETLQRDNSLLINCIYLLKALQMVGKESNNCFTPLQKLSDLALTTNNGDTDSQNNHNNHKKVESHPAFGFKASLIRVIGNLVYKHNSNQNTVRENDGIPLLLDCCNIDARNPMIMQWTILAIRNLLENNNENKEVISQSVKVGVVDNAVIKELGLTLNEGQDGNTIGIMPVPQNN